MYNIKINLFLDANLKSCGTFCNMNKLPGDGVVLPVNNNFLYQNYSLGYTYTLNEVKIPLKGLSHKN